MRASFSFKLVGLCLLPALLPMVSHGHGDDDDGGPVPEHGSIPDNAVLPDLVPEASAELGFLEDYYFETGPNGECLLRFSTAVTNYGEGVMHISSDPFLHGDQADVYQNIHLDDGATHSVLSGTFIHHAQHDHIHFESFADYRLREITGTSGVGTILAESEKVSFCLTDVYLMDSTLAATTGYGLVPDKACGHEQAINPGWADVYGSHLYGQWIDVTGVDAGTYWLEVEVDPENRLVESDETNNVVRIQVDIGEKIPEPSALILIGVAGAISLLRRSRQ